MVEVDVFWAYGIGAGFAAAATHQIAAGHATAPQGWPRWFSPYLTVTVLYCALLFAPSGLYLLWAFPDWETMQVARDHASLPAWLVTAFAFTNVSQGVLGYWVTQRLIRAGRRYLASLQMWIAYFGMFFVLVHGWDGRGYQRFFSADREVFESWPRGPSFGEALSRAGDWLTSPVALTLAAMSVIVVVLLWIVASWLRDGHRLANVSRSARCRNDCRCGTGGNIRRRARFGDRRERADSPCRLVDWCPHRRGGDLATGAASANWLGVPTVSAATP